MRRLAAGLAFAGALATAGQAAAWGGAGHQLTGAIADELLKASHPKAAAQVARILKGGTLQVAAPWPDCVRTVNVFQGGPPSWPSNNPTVPAVCQALTASQGLKDEMVAYARANWDQCSTPDPSHPCHTQYHFADIPEADGAYAGNRLPGATDHDVVHTINAAVMRLEGKTPPKPYAALTEREALFLLAHMVGDLHQPLHVGAVYLNPDGSRADPPPRPPVNMETIGGNAILYTKSGGLHALWDDIPTSLGIDGKPFVAEANAVQPTPGDYHGWAALWASDSVVQAHAPAFQGLVFGQGHPPTDPHKKGLVWPVTDKPSNYADILHAEQRVQIVKGGRHLADLLAAIWPDNSPAPPSGQPGPKPKKPKTPKPPPGGGAPA
jgi:hypothetical protein